MVNHHHHSHGGQHHQQPRLRADYRIPAIEKYAYCLCLHVKPTTIFIAVFKLIRALLFASILLNTEFAVNEHNPDLGLAIDSGHKSTAAAVNILARIIMASVSAVGIYAVISGRAALLMPLYAILLVDFFFSLPTFYNRDADPAFSDNIADLRSYPSPQANNQYTRYSIMLFSTLLMIIKIYFLCVIWKCYRYLRLIELVSPIIYPPYQGGGPCPIRIIGRPEQDLTDIGSGNSIAPPPYESIASSMKPPNYEEAMKATSASPIYNPTTIASALNQQQAVVLTTSINPDQQSPLHYAEQQHHLTISQAPGGSLAISITESSDTLNNIPSTTTTATTTSATSDSQQDTTSTNEKPQAMTEPTTTTNSSMQHSDRREPTILDKPPSVIIVDPNDSRDKH